MRCSHTWHITVNHFRFRCKKLRYPRLLILDLLYFHVVSPPLSVCFGLNTVECALRAWKASSVALLAFILCISSLKALSKSTVAPPVSVCVVTWRGGEGGGSSRSQTSEIDRCWCPRKEGHEKDCPELELIFLHYFYKIAIKCSLYVMNLM